jgi:hypothetical protein
MPGNGARTRYLHMFDKLVVLRKFVLCLASPVMLFCEVRLGCMQTIYPQMAQGRSQKDERQAELLEIYGLQMSKPPDTRRRGQCVHKQTTRDLPIPEFSAAKSSLRHSGKSHDQHSAPRGEPPDDPIKFYI